MVKKLVSEAITHIVGLILIGYLTQVPLYCILLSLIDNSNHNCSLWCVSITFQKAWSWANVKKKRNKSRHSLLATLSFFFSKLCMKIMSYWCVLKWKKKHLSSESIFIWWTLKKINQNIRNFNLTPDERIVKVFFFLHRKCLTSLQKW